jgi:hypothetical protein
MSDPSKEQEFREEAERLAQLPVEDQKRIVAMHRIDASNPKVPKKDRGFARERADALEKHLRRLNRQKKTQ